MSKSGNHVFRVSLLTVAAAMAGAVSVPSDAHADGDVVKPIVIYAFDTSGSMNGNFGRLNNTRYTLALQQLAGTAVYRENNGNIKRKCFDQTRVPRQYLTCSDNFDGTKSCDYKTVFVCYSTSNTSSFSGCDYVIRIRNQNWYVAELPSDVYKSNSLSANRPVVQ